MCRLSKILILTFCLQSLVFGGSDVVHPKWEEAQVVSLRFGGRLLLLDLQKNQLLHQIPNSQPDDCTHFAGTVRGNVSSLAAITTCPGDNFDGFIKMGRHSFLLNSHVNGSHSLEWLPEIKLGKERGKRTAEENGGYLVGGEAKKEEKKSQKGEFVCKGIYCEYFKVRRDEPKWLELAVVADASVVAFHSGSKEMVRRYVLTLLNIASAVYADPTLGANIRFVLLRLIFSQEEIIVKGNSKQSLDKVNAWNERLWRSLPSQSRHDAAIWLTRKDFGGASGYASVAGVCDPTRSCSLIREEGLSSAFIIAHELGHVLGMSHDGDKGAGNTCDDETSGGGGGVMSPTVGATFSYFHWSTCSAGEYHFKSSSWQCLLNSPFDERNATFIADTLEYAYSLDDQCRMEFGQGFVFCTSFQLNDPCSNLWCSHEDSLDVCKTKKGPPMDGTECGENQWCVNGYCEPMTKKRTSKDGLRHNPRAGGWSEWSAWGDCSRSCEAGAAFRTRQCNNPRPAHGGEPCRGDREEFRLCNLERPCPPPPADFRAQQCRDLFRVSGEEDSRSRQSWVPHERDGGDPYNCKLSCLSRESGELYQTGENVVDGTSCTYERPSDICVQGSCVKLGCDKIIGSPIQEDDCGICGGDGSKCKTKKKTLKGSLEPREEFRKIMTLPSGARKIKVILRSANRNMSLILQERGERLATTIFKSEPNYNNSFVAEGTKFRFLSGTLEGRGPLLRPLVLSVFSPGSNEATVFEVEVEHAISRQNEPLASSLQQNEWVVHGWSKCNRACGGGHQRVLLKCIDKISGLRIGRRHCGGAEGHNSQFQKTRRCNAHPCEYRWVAAAWEDCSHSCGSTGIRLRQAFCVPKGEVEDEEEKQVWRRMVHPEKCQAQKPKCSQACNRVPCPAIWHMTDWGSCQVELANSSSKCVGIQQRLFQCRPPTSEQQESNKEVYYDCKMGPPALARKCLDDNCSMGDQCKDQDDESVICADDLMKRYCVVPSYQRRCCKSCKRFAMIL